MKFLPTWPPRDWRMFIALAASVGAGVVAFILTWRVMTILSREDGWRKGLTLPQQLTVVLEQLGALKMMASGALILMGISILGLWFVLGKRSVEISAGNRFKLAAGGGTDDDDDPPAPQPIAQTTTTTTVLGSPPATRTTQTDQDPPVKDPDRV